MQRVQHGHGVRKDYHQENCLDQLSLRLVASIIEKAANLHSSKTIGWVAPLDTTEPEDRAYSLQGILDVNMYPMYRESTKIFCSFSENKSHAHQ
jgi:hypothetical protein